MMMVMMMTSTPVGEDRMKAQEITLRDAVGRVKFTGYKLVDLSWTPEAAKATSDGRRVRWTDMALYRVVDGNCMYVLHVVGRSVVYHAADGRCHKGHLTRIGDLYKNRKRYESLEKCRFCRPADLDELDDKDLVREERDRPSVQKCFDAYDLLDKLRKRKDKEEDGIISGLGMRLLDEAKLIDEDILDATEETRQL